MSGLSDLAKMLLARAGGRVIPRAMTGISRRVVWVDINKLARAHADMDMWASNRLGEMWGEDRKDEPAYAWHRGINGPVLCGAKMEANPLEMRMPLVEHQCTECQRIWHDLHWSTEADDPAGGPA
ncbi:MAG: hypothetical protein O7G84_00890 [Gammaproteobacteria bacterium]|nr:hypothetical protein [Gammaproteobacteria bacterium]